MSGLSKFVLTRGVLGWGVPFFLLTTAWDLFLNPRSNLRARSHFTSLLLYNFLLCFLLGSLFGWVVWKARSGKSKNQKAA